MERRYLLFGGIQFYARGGSHDLVSTHSTEEEVYKAATELNQNPRYEWWHVYDIETGTVIDQSQYQAYMTYQ